MPTCTIYFTPDQPWPSGSRECINVGTYNGKSAKECLLRALKDNGNTSAYVVPMWTDQFGYASKTKRPVSGGSIAANERAGLPSVRGTFFAGENQKS